MQVKKRGRGRPRKENGQFIGNFVTSDVETAKKEVVNFTVETLQRLKVGMTRGIDETGSLTKEDVEYNINLISRMIKHRYKTK